MLKPVERGSTLIAAQELRFLGRSYRPGDKFDYSRMGITHRRAVNRMLQARKLTELTQESLMTALRFRDKNAGPPRGFTLAGLRVLGLLTQEQIDAHGWAKRDQDAEITDENAQPKAWEAPDGAYRIFAEGTDEEKATDDTTMWVVPFRAGTRGAYRYFVHTPDGECVSGDASISGKENAENWARKFMADLSAAKDAKREGEPDWSAFPENPDDWSDEQVDVFDAWYEALQPGVEVKVEHEAVQKLYDERVEAKKVEQASAGEQTPGIFAGLNAEESKELLEAMTDEELRIHVAHVTNKPMDILNELTPLALREMAIAAQPPEQGAQNDGDVQSGAPE